MWTNRIVGYSEEPPDQLLANPKNYRTHPGTQAAALRGVLAEVGVVQNVLANRTTGFLIDGHLRVMEALKAGQPTIPVTWVELSEAEEALILATLDPLSALAGTDAAQLDALLREVSTGEEAVAQMLATLAEEAGIVTQMGEGGGGDDFDATPDDGPTRTALGELWVIGGVHRLIVGDSTDPATVARLMGGEVATLVFTDPPYNLGSENDLIAAPVSGAMRDLKGAKWDRNFDMRPALDRLLPVVASDATVYICTSHHLAPEIWAWMKEWADHYNWCVWAKTNPMPSLMKRHWTWSAELVCYATRGKHTFNFPMGGHALNVWTFPKDKETEHPTEKPVAVPTHAIEHSSKRDDLVYDPFFGSGTTLVAGHRLGRRVYGCELSPKWADVVLRRAEAEGLTCERLDTIEVDDGA